MLHPFFLPHAIRYFIPLHLILVDSCFHRPAFVACFPTPAAQNPESCPWKLYVSLYNLLYACYIYNLTPFSSLDCIV